MIIDFDPDSMMNWLWEFGDKYKNNEEVGKELYYRMASNDITTALHWPKWEDISVAFICTN